MNIFVYIEMTNIDIEHNRGLLNIDIDVYMHIVYAYDLSQNSIVVISTII